MSATSATFKAVPQVELTDKSKKVDGAKAGNPVAPAVSTPGNELKNAKGMSLRELLIVLKPFFWPAEGSDGAILNRIRALSTWAAVILSKASNLWSPLFLLDATNQLIVGDYYNAKNNIGYFVGLKLASSFFKEFQGALYVKVKQQALIQLQKYTFTHLHNLSLSWHLNKKAGAVMKSMDRGVEATNNLVTYLFLYLLPCLAECLVVMILFFTKFKSLWPVGITIGLSVFMYVVVTVRITIWRKQFREATNKHDNDYHDKAMDSITNFETVKYFTAEKYEVVRYAESVIKFQHFSSATATSMYVLNFSQSFIINACLVICMLISGDAVAKGEMTIGAWVAIQSWVGNIFAPLSFLGTIYSMIVQALIDVRNLSDLLSEKPDIVDLPTAKDIPFYVARASQQGQVRATTDANVESSTLLPKVGRHTDGPSSDIKNNASRTAADIELGGVAADGSDTDLSAGIGVEFRDVHFNYPSQPVEKGLKGVSFSVRPGSTTAIVGSTGAGKTTISRLLFRFYEPTAGQVLLGGQDLKHSTQVSVRSLIGVVPQDTVMFNESILYNIRYGRLDATDEEVYAAAEAAQIRSFVESLPESWKTVVGERGLKLSGGEKQRVAIARCLLKNPPVVVLDEATSALDTVTENSVQESLDALGQNRTVVIIAHRLSTIRQADQIIAMDNGLVVERGSHEELIKIPDGFYKRLWDMQSRVEPVTPVLNVTTAEVIVDATNVATVDSKVL